jgi:putative peptidoglycan lipid II flippase
MYKMMLPATLGLAVVHINISVDANFANFLGPGRVTYLRNANRLIQFPLALFATALATAILPQLTRFLLENKKAQLQEMISFAFQVVIIIFIPAMVGFIVLERPIIELILQRGYWTEEATLNTRYALTFYSLGLLPIAFLRILTPLYYARQDVMTPFKMGIIALLTNIALNAFFIFFTPMEHGGLAFASSIAAVVNFYLLFHREKEVFGPVFTKKVRTTLHRVFFSSILMGICTWSVHKGLCLIHPRDRFVLKAVYTLSSIGVGVGTYLLFGKLLGIKELDRALNLVLRRR